MLVAAGATEEEEHEDADDTEDDEDADEWVGVSTGELLADNRRGDSLASMTAESDAVRSCAVGVDDGGDDNVLE